MSSWWVSGLAVITLTLLSIFVFPGRTILQADTQIYIPILEHIADPTLLTNDIMAVRPHVSFTLYDEAALVLRAGTGLSFEQILAGQQIIYRAVAVLGLYLLGTAAGLAPALSWLFAALISLGGAIIGPAVLIVEYEPVPRGFALPFLILSLAMVASSRWYAAATSATLAFAFHPPTALAYCGVLGFVLLWNRVFGAIAVLASGPLVLLFSVMLQAPIEKAPLFGTIDPVWESLQRMRAAYNWVSLWVGQWMWLYVALWAVGWAAWWRVRHRFNRETNLILVTMPAIGMLSVPLSYLLLERMKLVIAPQFQPGRYLLFVSLFAMILAVIAGIYAAQQKRNLEALAFLIVPIAVSASEWDTAKLLDGRAVVVFGLAVLVIVAAANASRRWLVALASVVPFFALPYVGGVQNYAPLHTTELDDLAQWARENTPKEALFQFGDAERRPEPGVFRARAKRALYIDWKAGGQVNFMRPFAMLWAERWEAMKRLRPIEEYRMRRIDYLVLRKTNPISGMRPVYENPQWLVYDLRNSSTSVRKGIDACAPMRVTESAAAAFAKRSASGSGRPSESAIANPALKVSPAAVVSRAVTANPGA